MQDEPPFEPVRFMNKSLMWRAALVLLVFCSAFYASYKIFVPPPPPLPFFDPADVNPDLVDPALRGKGRGHVIGHFQLTDQNGEEVSQELVKGKVYMADFFFTTCPSICKDMAAQKRWLQENMQDRDDFLILSHSVMPEVDSVSVLADYAEWNQAMPGKWYLLTGNRDSIYSLARKSYLVAKEPSAGEEHDFIHTENFVLVDRRGRIRGFYDGTSAEAVQQLALDARRLLDADY